MIEFGSEPVVFHLDMTIELLGQSKLFKLVHSPSSIGNCYYFVYQSFGLFIAA